jgi:cell wall-associated NlpC family hydrolase
MGNGMFIHASSAQHKVTTSGLNSGYYASAFMTARRIID